MAFGGEPCWQREADAMAETTPTDQDLNKLQLTTLQYYLHETNPANGLVRDKTDPGTPSSIAAVGLALAALPVVVERGVFDREFAPEMALRKLRFFAESPHGPEPDAAGYRGFYYHSLDMHTGRRAWQCELSTIDTALLLAGMLVCAAYFDRDTPDEAEVRRLAHDLYARADWDWARDGGPSVTHGWRPETGFIPHRLPRPVPTTSRRSLCAPTPIWSAFPTLPSAQGWRPLAITARHTPISQSPQRTTCSYLNGKE
jgi:hypothetical protein